MKITPNLIKWIEKTCPEATVHMAEDNGQDIDCVWKWRGERDWIPITQIIVEEAVAARELLDILNERD